MQTRTINHPRFGLPTFPQLPSPSCALRFLFSLPFTVALLLYLSAALPVASAQTTHTPWWPAPAEAALDQAGTNRQEILNTLQLAPDAERPALLFLITNMPARDLQTLTASFILEHVSLAYRARQEFPWAKDVPEDIFLNEVLPYANMDESRDRWRQQLLNISRPLVRDCKTLSEAAIALNQQLFKVLNVQYSTRRRAAVQGPLETISSGMATCTGLSILLVDACRSVGVPARVVGTPLWVDRTGNHTWVEIWDGGWHFTGAAEQDPQGLNRGWFVGNASKALKDVPENAIYAVSFRKTELSFPMRWARRASSVSAVNVTERYAAASSAPEPVGTRLVIDVYNRPRGERIAARVTVTDTADPSVKYEGDSKDETADMNNHLAFDVPKQRTYLVQARWQDLAHQQFFTTGTERQDRLAIFLSGIPSGARIPQTTYAPPLISQPLPPDAESILKQALTSFFTTSPHQQDDFTFDPALERLLLTNEPAVRKLAWDTFRSAPIHASAREQFETRKVRSEQHVSPYTLKTVGTRPTNGWALVIAMHGGGNAPQEVNDSQWRVMQRYYRDHPQVGGYHYVALRAPNNEWNGFYTGYVYPLIANLIRQFLLFADVDPNKVFLMGYSHGGYGAFAIGPKMPDRFAAIHASAAAPADGSHPITLRNTVFSCMLGEKDTMYGRYDLIRTFEKDVAQLRGDRTDIYPVSIQIIADHPHSGLPDRDKIAEIYPASRNPVPRDLSWRLTDNVIRDFFWLHVPEPQSGQELNAFHQDNRLTVSTSSNLTTAAVLLDSRLVDLSRPVRLEWNGQVSSLKLEPRLRTLCETLARRGDPELAFSSEVRLPPSPATESAESNP